MSYKVATPEQAYKSDNLYENRLCKAMDYLSAILSAPRTVDFLQLVGHKPTYVINYDMANGSPDGVDDVMASRIVELFKEAGWHDVYWKTLEPEPCNPLHPRWGYVFYFERPIESVPYQVMVRLAKATYGTASGVVDELGSIRTSVKEVCEVFDVMLRVAEGNEFAYTGDTSCIDLDSPEYKGTGIYKVSGTAVRFLVAEMADWFMIYRKPCGTLYRAGPEHAWVPYAPGEITLNNNLLHNALNTLRARYEQRPLR